MKKALEIYKSINDKFKSLTKLDISKGSVLDCFMVSTSKGIEEAHKEIESNKNPHLYSSLTGSRIDDLGVLVGCVRASGENDSTYLFRVINWNTGNQASNSKAIETALINMEYSSNVTYVPYTHGVGTASAYIIPNKLDSVTIELAKTEVQEKLREVVSKSAYIEYIIPQILPVKIIALYSVFKDSNNIKVNIADKFKEHINNIKPGEHLEMGELNKIGIMEKNMEYFTITNLFIDNKEVQDIKTIQKLESKLVFDSIVWNEVSK